MSGIRKYFPAGFMLSHGKNAVPKQEKAKSSKNKNRISIEKL
jgi:hypothetical protein